MAEYKHIEYMCRYCGKKTVHSVSYGRPLPGRCPRKKGNQPHSWGINRKW